MRYLFSLILILSLSAFGAEEIQIPALNSPVMDEAGFLSPDQKENLGKLAYEIHAHQGPQITVLTVNDMQGYEIEEFSIRVAEKWKLGTKEAGNGILILIAKQERKMRIEVGQGIEGEITDFEANRYIKTVLTPFFKSGDFYGGLQLVMLDIARKFNIQLNGKQTFVRRATPAIKFSGPLKMALPFLIIFLVLGQILLSKKPLARGLFTGSGVAGTAFFFLTGINIAAIALLFLFGLFIGTIGLSNLLFALASGGGHHGGGFRSGGGFGGGGGSWGGGGGGFSGGGSSGSW